ncbi:sulfite exporter TauE/SafE family protein [Xylanibacter oryzae]|uniref:sulfite exporter TauE/SafE family protein n=1 Tax=Xylanibacter oryzae TaxID=185293 RepID=UPI0004B6FA57|nr:sulfite exporter TauE/SafE family protein [Xylanibacter oryzae]
MIFDFNTSFLFLPLFGLVIGILVSMFGGGGGGLYVPLLTILFNVPIQVAVSTSLASIIPTTIFGAYAHYKQGNVNVSIGLIFGITGIIGTLLGVFFSTLIPPFILRKLFGTVAILLVIPIFFKKKEKENKYIDNPDNLKKINLTTVSISLIFGLLSGIMAGLFGISGTFPIIMGLYMLRFPANMVIGTSVFVLFFNAISGLFGHFAVGHINFILIILLGGSAAIGALIGPSLLKRIKADVLDKWFKILVISITVVTGLIMIIK